MLCIRRGYRYFPSKVHCLTVPQKFVRESFCLWKKFWYRKFSCIREGVITLLSETFCLTGPKRKTRYGNFPVSQNFSGNENILSLRGGVITIFLSEIVHVSQIVKKHLTRKRFEPGPTALERCFPYHTADIHYWIKRVGIFGLKITYVAKKTTYASRTRVGITLGNKQNDNTIRILAFASPYLNWTEKNYSIGKLELIPVVWGLEKFRFILYGKVVYIYTDHQALKPLIKRNRPYRQWSARLTRWLDKLAYLDISIKQTAGKI